ncbi:MAG: hypothetical protein Q4G69_08210 [Planctomycetia bacterium]|nr:hypothetical protein [Planctomycetia bacterium]
MKLTHSFKVGIWCLIGLNLLMAFVSIWVFVRMAPAIERIISRNTKSIDGGEAMLVCLSELADDGADRDVQKKKFELALQSVRGNITEKHENEAIDVISANYLGAIAGNSDELQKTIVGIMKLNEVNREAVQQADRAASRLGIGGAWAVVIMASFVFLAGILYAKFLTRSLVDPLEELYSVAESRKGGDSFRRCCGPDLPDEITEIYHFVNGMMDSEHE